ncbi:MAG: hypothetical protein ACK5NK_04260 [Niabella sp.]
MNALQFLKTALLATAVLFSACSKDDDNIPNDPNNPDVSAFFSAKVDNQSFPKANLQFTAAKFVSSTKMLQIIGQPQDQKESIVLLLMSFGGKVTTAADWKPGTYDFDPIHVSNLEYLAIAGYSKWNGNSYDMWGTQWDYVKTGKIIIESNSGTQIKGTFFVDVVRQNNDGTFNASDIKKITEGKFDLAIKIY